MQDAPHFETLRLIVEDYRLGAGQRARQAVWWGAEGLSLKDAVRRSALAQIDGTIHPHQRRQGYAALREAAEYLSMNAEILAAARDFKSLHAGVMALLKRFWKKPTLLAYDTADRIAYYLRLEPDEVHLHQGTADGAKVLGFKGSLLRTADLPGALAELSAREAEDVLCTYKKHFLVTPDELRRTLSMGGSSNCRPPQPRRPRC